MLKVKTALGLSNPSLCRLLSGTVDPGLRPLTQGACGVGDPSLATVALDGVLPSGSLALKARWRLIGGTPQEQCAREEQARQWDEKVSSYLWNEPTLKQFGPGWRPAGRLIAKATDHPNQSMMNPDRLADWYDGKLDYLRSVIERCGLLSSEAQRPAQSS
jgi:hypothetical protein